MGKPLPSQQASEAPGLCPGGGGASFSTAARHRHGPEQQPRRGAGGPSGLDRAGKPPP